jgi:hypothetical protein
VLLPELGIVCPPNRLLWTAFTNMGRKLVAALVPLLAISADGSSLSQGFYRTIA